jgi:predicted DCC family thiol-disulfide oxidoreductase YuxK
VATHSRAAQEPAPEPIVIFDGVCNLCESSVLFIIRRDAAGRFRFAAAQSSAGRELQQRYALDALDLETLILIKDGRAFTRSDAFLHIARELDRPWRLLAALRVVPRSLRDRAYALVARNRYRWFGRKPACMVPSEDVRARFLE